MSRIVALAVAMTLATAPALPVLAQDAPKPGPADPRIKVVDYDPWAVVRVVGVVRTATQVVFGEEETILHVAIGDTTGWEVAVERNILFVKPKAVRAPTNLIVTTSRGGGTRNYTFELASRDGASSKATSDTVFGLRFRYPDDAKQAAVAAIDSEAAQVERQIVQLKLDRAVLEGRRNLAYAVQGSTALQPSEISDNGQFTIMRFPANQPVPTIYQVESSGTESLVPFDVRGEFVVIHAVARELRLRRGREVLCIYNEAFEPYGVRPATGTAASDVDRTEKGGPRP